MSFLNPVNEPVHRFKSTDAGAPQINYAARVAGDVKAILKACLVTGYGAIASAGWTAVNEVAHVIEFISPSAAMSDYRLGIDDASASSTTWYYQYQDARTNPVGNSINRNFTAANNSSIKNGWQLLVTSNGIVLVELIEMSVNSGLVTRVTYWGALKSTVEVSGRNIAFWSVGADSPSATPSAFFSNTAVNANYKVNSLEGLKMTAVNFTAVTSGYIKTPSYIELISPIFVESANGDLVAQQPAVSLRTGVSIDSIFTISETTQSDGRNMLNVCIAYAAGGLSTLKAYAATLSIYTDYWEY